MAIDSRKVTFTGAQGDELAARLEVPAGPVRATAIFAHCFTCGMDNSAAARISAGLAEQGYAVLRFDFTGLGGSGGDFANTHFQSNIDDLVAAATYLVQEMTPPSLLVGHSLGGAAVLHATSRIPSIKAVATIGAPFDPEHVTHLLGDKVDAIASEGEAEVKLAGRPFRIKKSFLDELRDRKPDEIVAKLGAALMVMHAPLDDYVSVSNARDIFVHAKHPKSFVSLDDANHLLTRKADAQYTASVLAAWAAKYIPDAGQAAMAPAPRGGEVVVAETRTGKFTQSIRVGRHALPGDEPVSVGGNDTGPAPYDYLLAGLGECTSMTVRMYADRKKWPLDRVTVRLSHQKIHADDCATCETTTGKLDHIARELVLEGDLDEEQRAKLTEIADKCPVHRTLHSEVKIDTKLV